MMVTFISQCEKNALKKTRRVLDAFANRIGDNAWQTVITEEGLKTVKKMLRQTASKSTAVSCHWIRSRSRSQFLWVVGNKSKFDERGVVPVNFTENEIDQYMDKNQWQTLELIQYASAIAGLFHDVGKANELFQKKINPTMKTESFEPYRHEWGSLRLFQAFVSNKDDEQWLEGLSGIEKEAFSEYFKDGIAEGNQPQLAGLSPFARLVAWLIVTHHRLPVYPGGRKVNSLVCNMLISGLIAISMHCGIHIVAMIQIKNHEKMKTGNFASYLSRACNGVPGLVLWLLKHW